MGTQAQEEDGTYKDTVAAWSRATILCGEPLSTDYPILFTEGAKRLYSVR